MTASEVARPHSERAPGHLGKRHVGSGLPGCSVDGQCLRIRLEKGEDSMSGSDSKNEGMPSWLQAFGRGP